MGERTTFKTNRARTPGYLARPAKPGQASSSFRNGWGLSRISSMWPIRFASEGFVALAPDVYHGQTAKSPDEAGKLMMSLRVDDAEPDLAGAIDYLTALPDVIASRISRVGTIGFCMGGALSLFAASKNPEGGACVVFYGIQLAFLRRERHA